VLETLGLSKRPTPNLPSGSELVTSDHPPCRNWRCSCCRQEYPVVARPALGARVLTRVRQRIGGFAQWGPATQSLFADCDCTECGIECDSPWLLEEPRTRCPHLACSKRMMRQSAWPEITMSIADFCKTSKFSCSARLPHHVGLQSGRIGSKRRRPGCISQGVGSRDCGADGKGIDFTGVALVGRLVSCQLCPLGLPDAAACSMLRRQLLQLARRLCQDTSRHQHSPPSTH